MHSRITSASSSSSIFHHQPHHGSSLRSICNRSSCPVGVSSVAGDTPVRVCDWWALGHSAVDSGPIHAGYIKYNFFTLLLKVLWSVPIYQLCLLFFALFCSLWLHFSSLFVFIHCCYCCGYLFHPIQSFFLLPGSIDPALFLDSKQPALSPLVLSSYSVFVERSFCLLFCTSFFFCISSRSSLDSCWLAPTRYSASLEAPFSTGY